LLKSENNPVNGGFLYKKLTIMYFEVKLVSGLFGTNAVLIVDLTLLIQIIAFILLTGALYYKAKKNFKLHGSLMGVALMLHFINFLFAMLPSFIGGFSYLTGEINNIGVQTLWVHAVTGALSLILGFFLLIAWLPKYTDLSGCFKRKRLMDATTLLWSVSLVFGILTYIIFYT